MHKRNLTLLFLHLISPVLLLAQYTDVINSNRPGRSVSAYALGRSVVQAEFGLSYEQRDHDGLSWESDILGADLSLRYGLLFETLEVNWEATFISQDINFTALGMEETRTNFSRNRLGLKYLIFDPYKDQQRTKPNLYSWRANNLFQWKNLIPAVSVYAGATFVLGDNPFYVGDPTVSPRAMVATQSTLSPKLVLISNIAYDRIGTDFPELSYIVSLSHAFRNPSWSVFVENQGIQSDRYADVLIRTGIAHLFNENFQADITLGGSIKDSPSRIFGGAGLSYRLDFHQDIPRPIDDQRAGANGGPIKKNSMKPKKAKRPKKSRTGQVGAEDVDLKLSKKERRRQRKIDN